PRDRVSTEGEDGMKQPTGGESLTRSVALAAAVWGSGSLLYGAVEALTNTGAGLHQPLRIWAVMWGIYGLNGLGAGVVAGLVVFAWRRMRGRLETALGASLAALFFGSFLFAFLAVPINDRFLPLLLSPRSLVVNGVLIVGCAAVGLLLHRHLRGRTGMGLVLSPLHLPFFFTLSLTLTPHLDP